MANYSTLDYLPDLTSKRILGATQLTFSAYTPTISGIKWDNSTFYSTSESYAILKDTFKWNAVEGATYDIFSTSYFDPFLVQVYDNFGNAIAVDSSSTSDRYGTDYVWNFKAPYSGVYYVSAGWDQGSFYKYVSISIYEDIDTATFKTPIALPKISFSSGVVFLTEGNSGSQLINFTVSISETSFNPIYINYATSNETATAGSDYVATSGTLTFAPGEISKIISVPILGDMQVEPIERFFVNLTNSRGASMEGLTSGIGTILNDDLTPLPSNRVEGTAGNDTLIGGLGEDTLMGRDGNDTFIGFAGSNNYFDGGSGIDTVVFTRNRAEYTISDLSSTMKRGYQCRWK